MSRVVNWGIIGCGGIANKFAESASAAADVKIIAAASRTNGKAEAFAQTHNIENYYDDYSTMLENNEVEAVYVGTTHNYHFENVKQILEAGKHVLCEKPFTVNASEMKALVDLATEKKLFMMEAMWTRFLPAIVHVRSLLKDQIIGEIKQLRVTFGFNFPFDPENRLYNPKLAGGALLDAGIYPLSFANMVMRDAPVEIKAIAEIGRTGVDEQTMCLFRYESGVVATLTAAINAPVVSRAEIIGTKGRITIPEKFLGAEEVWLELSGAPSEKERFEFDAQVGFKFEIEAASESIRTGALENDIMPLTDTLQLMETIDCVRDQIGLSYENDKGGM